ncbi:MAG: caspase family protein [Myxococcaceae bacterium]|nr:caspase family protein [Myxococcaceae bacterium]
MTLNAHQKPGAALRWLLTALLALPAWGASGPVRRFALVVGNDLGGENTRPLLYARDDARKLYDIMVRLGGIQPADAMLLLNESADDVLTALGELERRSRDAQRQGEQTGIFFYYSGHARDGALRLGGSRLALESLKARLAQAPADIRIAIFDACRSGALTRAKGVRRAPAFEVESDATRAAKGLVILTSSAADEDSQESDTIGGSYFSHHLASGLLGDADKSGDGRISLSEAYAYAYERTVADTAESSAGPQHPTFSFDLAGNGDLVLTDVAARREGIALAAAAPAGNWFVVDSKGFIVAEVMKTEGLERRIALPPGTYTVKRRLADKLRVGQINVAEGQITQLDDRSLKDTAFSDDPVKGVGRALLYSKHWSFGLQGTWQAVFDTPTDQGGLFPSSPNVGLEGTWHNFFGRGFSWTIDGMAGTTGGTLNTGALQNLAYRYTLFSVGTGLLVEWPEGSWGPFVGARLGLNLMSRDFEVSTLPRQTFSVLTPGLVGGLKVRLTQNFALSARVRLHYLLYNIDETKNFGFLELATCLSYEFRE